MTDFRKIETELLDYFGGYASKDDAADLVVEIGDVNFLLCDECSDLVTAPAINITDLARFLADRIA